MATAPTPSDAELRWQQSYSFDHHQIVGVYTRLIKFTVDTSENASFNAALRNPAITAVAVLQSRTADQGRYGLRCTLNEVPGKLGCHLQRLRNALPGDHQPVVAKFSIKLFTDNGPLPVRRMTCKRRFALDAAGLDGVGAQWGWKYFEDLSTLRKNTGFMKQNKLVFKVDIQEFMSSDSCDFLPQPGIKVRDLVQRISQLCSNPVNTCFVLSDGTYHAHKELMAASCEHFNILLNGDFSEANQLKRKRENDDKQGSDMLAIEAPDKLGTMLLEETDGAMPEHCQCTLPNRSTSVALPNFSKSTFEAFTFYLHTKTITFQSIPSAELFAGFPNDIAVRSALPGHYACDPKLMYEMADYFDVPELRDLCQNAIMACITPDNVLDELADDFACLHKPISEALQQYAISNWASVATSARFKENMNAAMKNGLSREAVINILQRSCKPPS